MLFTPLHRELGYQPGPLTDAMLDDAITLGVTETDDLDWKKPPLPAAKDLANSDIPKDIAAMANRGGGMIIYGMEEQHKRATHRRDIGEVSETYERTYRAVAVRNIHPPVFGLGFHRFSDGPERALAVVVPPSIDVPHLIYRGEYFGAPIRNDADTVWMREQQIERLYRTRLDERRHAGIQVKQDYLHVRDQYRTAERVWMIGVARPRITPPVIADLTAHEARRLIQDASTLARLLANSQFNHPLGTVSDNPRPGLRRWVAPPSNSTDSTKWKQAWAGVQFDGSVFLAAALGGGPSNDGDLPGDVIDSRRVEWFVTDLFALVKTAGEALSNESDYELLIDLEPSGHEPTRITTTDNSGHQSEGPQTIRRFIPIETTVQTTVSPTSYLDQVRQAALDIVNQAGLTKLVAINLSPSH